MQLCLIAIVQSVAIHLLSQSNCGPQTKTVAHPWTDASRGHRSSS